MGRRVEFLPGGTRRRIEPAAVAAAWVRATTKIPPQYACGTAQHETDFTANEVDTEESGFVSKGIFQLSDEEAAEAGRPGADLLNLDQAAAVLAAVAQHRLAAIVVAAHLDGWTRLPNDVWAYLALAHNQGLGAALKTIRLHGLDWTSYKKRNSQLAAMAAYGDDCVSGGARWSEVTP
jgi:hypothetical protein